MPNLLEAYKTPEFCLAAVQYDGMALMDVPNTLKTPEVCLAAVQQNGFALEYVPKALKTPELCLAAVQNDGEALMYVPKAFKTSEICIVAVQQTNSAFEYVPKALKTPELCLIAVRKHVSAFAFVPSSLKTLEICLAAVQQNGQALQDVPEKLKTPKLCLTAVCHGGGGLRYVPKVIKEVIKRQDYILDGSDIPLWGQNCVLRLLPGRFHAKLTGDTLQLRLPYPADQVCCIRALNRVCNTLLLKRARFLVADWSRTLGIAVPKLHIEDMRHWGRCYFRAGRVSLAAELIWLPPKVLEYIVVHELVHFLVNNHNTRFWAILDQHLPDWRQWDNLLNNYHNHFALSRRFRVGFNTAIRIIEQIEQMEQRHHRQGSACHEKRNS